MKYFRLILFFLPAFSGCVTEYIPGLKENEELLVVEGLITDQPGENTIYIYKTLPLWTRDFRSPLRNCNVWITDDLNTRHDLREVKVGTYATDSATFRGTPGRKYVLNFTALSPGGALHHYESLPMEMKPVSPIDSIYYEKRDFFYYNLLSEGCQIFLDTYDPTDSGKFYRWEYEETWEFRLPFPDVTKKTCWASEKSSEIMIRNTAMLGEKRIVRYPLKLIKNPIDRLGVKYSILVRQYSLNEDEYYFWERLQNSVGQIGGLYDVIPSSITGNIYCLEDKLEKVLGYFSVSAVSSRRSFITDTFTGRNMMYVSCVDSVLYGAEPIDSLDLDVFWWVLYDYTDSVPPRRVLTNQRVCGDCAARGSVIRPDFWDDDK